MWWCRPRTCLVGLSGGQTAGRAVCQAVTHRWPQGQRGEPAPQWPRRPSPNCASEVRTAPPPSTGKVVSRAGSGTVVGGALDNAGGDGSNRSGSGDGRPHPHKRVPKLGHRSGWTSLPQQQAHTSSSTTAPKKRTRGGQRIGLAGVSVPCNTPSPPSPSAGRCLRQFRHALAGRSPPAAVHAPVSGSSTLSTKSEVTGTVIQRRG